MFLDFAKAFFSNKIFTLFNCLKVLIPFLICDVFGSLGTASS